MVTTINKRCRNGKIHIEVYYIVNLIFFPGLDGTPLPTTPSTDGMSAGQRP